MVAGHAARAKDVDSRIFRVEPRLALGSRRYACTSAGSDRQVRRGRRRSSVAAIQSAIGRNGNIQRQRHPLDRSLALAPQNLERPLALRCGAFGDMVLLTALIRVLHAEFRAPVDIVTSGSWSEPLLRGQPGVGDIFSVRSRKTPYWLSIDQQRVVRQLRARGAGPVWFCDGNDAGRLILTRAGIPDELIVAAKDHDLQPGEHATEQWRRLAQIMPSAAVNTNKADLKAVLPGCYLEVTAAQRSDLNAWLHARDLAGQPLILV